MEHVIGCDDLRIGVPGAEEVDGVGFSHGRELSLSEWDGVFRFGSESPFAASNLSSAPPPESRYLCKALHLMAGNRGKFPGERGLAYAGAGRMRLARGGIFGPGTPRRSPMKS